MVTNHHGLHYIHKKKRQTKKLKLLKSKKRWIKFVDDLMLVFAIMVPLMAIPQAITIWSNKSALDVSLITWVAFLVSSIAWLIYSLVHKNKPLIANSSLWVIINSSVILGIILFR